VDNIKIDLRAVGCANVKLIHLACYFLWPWYWTSCFHKSTEFIDRWATIIIRV